MKRVFISHSSRDKSRIVEPLVKLLGKERIEYDRVTFDEARKTWDEITTAFDRCSHVLIVISEEFLESEWCLKEIEETRQRLDSKKLDAIAAIRIDPDIKHDDCRIPEWLRNNYNLVYQPNVRRITDLVKLRFFNAGDTQINRITLGLDTFAGRNQQLDDFETRIDSIVHPLPKVILVSGWPLVGRTTFLQHALRKANLIRSSIFCPQVIISEDDSIEDLIVRLAELGIVSGPGRTNIVGMTISQKIDSLQEILFDLASLGYVPIIRDDRCIFDVEGRMASWFRNAIEPLDSTLVAGIIVSRKPFIDHRSNDSISFYSVAMPELSKQERKWLFSRLLRNLKISLTKDQIDHFLGLFSGYPDQIGFAAQSIAELGVARALSERSKDIEGFAKDSAKIVLKRFQEDEVAMNILLLLSKLEYVETGLLAKLANDENAESIIANLIAEGVCYFIGIEGQFIRLNDLARPVIGRLGLKSVNWEIKKKLTDEIREAVNRPEDFDNGFLQYAVSDALEKRDIIGLEQYILPSYLISVIKRISNQPSKLDRAIALCERLLESSGRVDQKVELTAHYFLCVCFARKGEHARFFAECEQVRRIDPPTANFLMAFWNRLSGRLDEAEHELKKVGNVPRLRDRVEVEMLTMMLAREKFDDAFDLAYEKFIQKSKNPYIIRMCFIATLHSSKGYDRKDLLLELISAFDSCIGERVEGFRLLCEAEYASWVEGISEKSFAYVDAAIQHEPDTRYAYETGCQIAVHFKDRERWQVYFKGFSNFKNTMSKSSFVKLEVWDLAFQQDLKKLKFLFRGKLAKLASIEIQNKIKFRVCEWLDISLDDISNS